MTCMGGKTKKLFSYVGIIHTIRNRKCFRLIWTVFECVGGWRLPAGVKIVAMVTHS